MPRQKSLRAPAGSKTRVRPAARRMTTTYIPKTNAPIMSTGLRTLLSQAWRQSPRAIQLLPVVIPQNGQGMPVAFRSGHEGSQADRPDAPPGATVLAMAQRNMTPPSSSQERTYSRLFVIGRTVIRIAFDSISNCRFVGREVREGETGPEFSLGWKGAPDRGEQASLWYHRSGREIAHQDAERRCLSLHPEP